MGVAEVGIVTVVALVLASPIGVFRRVKHSKIVACEDENDNIGRSEISNQKLW